MKFIQITLLSLFSLVPLFGQDLLPKDKENFHLFLLVGQSNMAGRGKVSDTDLVPNPRVLALSKDLKWKPAVDPIHFDKKIAGVGLGKTFGLQIAETDPAITIGLIPCAVGGSPIRCWEPGGYHQSTKSHPWDDMLPRALEAMKYGTLKGILWHQGESDSNETYAPLYKDKLHALVKRFRETLKTPDVPFIAGQMGNFKERPWDEYRVLVDSIHHELPSQIPNTAFVNSKGLEHKGDKVHFNAASYRTLGKRYADAWLKMVR